MRVAILTSWYPSVKDPTYGIFVRTQAKGLSKYIDTHVFLINRGITSSENIVQDDKIKVYKKSCFYLPNINEKLLQKWAHQYYIHFKEKHDNIGYDIIHCHDHYGAYAGWYINKIMGIPYVVTIHNTSILTKRLPSWKQNYLPKILNNAKEVIAVGKSLAKVLEKDFTNKTVTILPNYIDTELYSPSQKVKSLDVFKFIFVGSLEERKGVIELTKAFANLRQHNVELHIIGEGLLKNEIQNIIISERIENKVFLHGVIENHLLPSYYNNCHCYVSLSKEETFGVTVLEAMSCGLPVIYTRSGGPEHIVPKFGSIETSKTDIEQITIDLKKMINTYKEINHDEIRKHVLNNFSSESVIQKLIKIYKRD